MAALPEYSDKGPVTIPSSLNLSNLKGKSVLVTGGASGLGKAYAEAFVKAGSYVTILDLDEKAGEAVADELGNARFVKSNVLDWDSQVRGFESAISNSPHKSLDIVIANAGIFGADDMSTLDDPTGPPVKPNLKCVDINLTGVLYTTKLAIHYFRRQPVEPSRDRCLILKSSLAGYIDIPGSPQYNASKYGVRGLMKSLRRTLWSENIRLNLVAPWYVRTPILADSVQQYLDGVGAGFATIEDCAKTMLLISTDTTINGRGFAVVSRHHDSEGVKDLDLDDYKEGLYRDWQKIVIDTGKHLHD